MYSSNPQSYNDRRISQHAIREGWLLTALLLWLMSLGASAGTAGLPTGVCSGRVCGPHQSALWQRFQEGRGLEWASIPAVYSGICYVNAPNFHPHRAHHVGLYLDDQHQGTTLGVRFTFYAAAQPYDNLDIEDARARFSKPLLDVDIYDDYAYAQVLGSFEPFRYWLRRDADSEGLLLVSYFGFVQTMLCELETVTPKGVQ